MQMTIEETEKFLASAVEFSETSIKQRAGEFDRNGALPKEIIEGLAQRGILGATIPKEYGGIGLDPLSYGRLTEIIGKACCSSRTLLTVHASLVCETLLKLANSAQKKRYLPKLAHGKMLGCFALSEPENGSDASSINMRYECKENKFILNGKKKWVSFGGLADLFIVIAKEGDTISAFLVEKTIPGINTKPIVGLLGNRATHMAEITFTDVEVPKENVLGKIGTGFTFVANTALFYGRYSIAWAGVAIAQAALEEMSKYAIFREQFGHKIGQYQLIKGLIADAVTQVHAARALCQKAGEYRVSNDDQAIMETNIAKYFTSKVAVQVSSDAVQVFGGNGCWDQYPVERLYRESKILEIIEGTSQIQQILIGDHGMKKYSRQAVYT